MNKKIKILRSTTVPMALNDFCKGHLNNLQKEGYECIAISSNGKELEEYGLEEKVRTIGVDMERHISPFKDIKSLWNLIKVLKKEKPQIIHSINPKAGLLSMLASWFTRVPIRINTFTGLIFPTTKGFKKRILIFTDKLTCACATHVIPEGEGVKYDLIKNKITKKPIKVLGYGNIKGIDLKYFDPDLNEVKEKAEKIRKSNIFTYIFIGRIVGDKGINELITTFSKLNKEFPASRLILVGDREEQLDPLKKETIEEINSNPAIIEVGRQKDIRPYLLASDALAFPSYREGMPNVVIEAGAMGLPSIVTDINGSREIIKNGVNGVIIPPKDEKALYQAMKDMICNKDKRENMASRSREMVASRYEVGFVQNCLKDFYKEALKEKHLIQ